MVRLPRDLSGRDSARALRRYGYEVTRETGSHMRLTTQPMATHGALKTAFPTQYFLSLGVPRLGPS
jgi:hypothetical protein